MDSPNLSSLAAALKLSPSTVSRVLSGQAERFRISPATRERVLAEAAKSGLVVDAVARGLRLRTTQTLGLVIPDVSNPFFAALARQIEHQARARGYSVLLADSPESVAVEAEAVRLMHEGSAHLALHYAMGAVVALIVGVVLLVSLKLAFPVVGAPALLSPRPFLELMRLP